MQFTKIFLSTRGHFLIYQTNYKYMVMVSKGAFTKIVNLMAQRSGALVLGQGSFCHIVETVCL